MKLIQLHSNNVYQGRAFSVDRLLLQLPDGHQKEYDLILHRPSVSLVPIDQAGLVYFVRQYRVGPAQELLELPAGVLEENEDPAEGARREMREEIGMAAGNLVKIGEFFLAPGYSSELMHVYLATELYPAPLPPDDDEFLQLETLPLTRAYELAVNGEIRDSKTIAALLLARRFVEHDRSQAFS